MVLWVVIMIVPYLRVWSHFLRALSYFWFCVGCLETLEKGSGRRISAPKSLLSVILTHGLSEGGLWSWVEQRV